MKFFILVTLTVVSHILLAKEDLNIHLNIEDIVVMSIECSESTEGFQGIATLVGNFPLHTSITLEVPWNAVEVEINSEKACTKLLNLQRSEKPGQVIFKIDKSNSNNYHIRLFGVLSGANNRTLLLNE